MIRIYNSKDKNMESSPEKVELNRLKYFPVMMFAIVMGLSGLTIAYQKASEVLGFPKAIANMLMYVDLFLFFGILGIYLIKLIKYPKAVSGEWKHPVRINFFAAISISILMLGIITKHPYPSLSATFWYVGTAMHTYLTLYTISFWINHNQELSHSNPAWFIPIVGNVLVPIGGVGLASKIVLMYFFSVGVFFWIILFAILLNRIIFHHQLAQKFMPTLFIFLAPPAVAFLAYYKLYHELDAFALFLYSIALFFTLLLLFMVKVFMGLKYFISWWAFIFPLAAMAIASMVVHHITKDIATLYISYAMIGFATLMTLTVVYQTIKHMFKHEICIQE